MKVQQKRALSRQEAARFIAALAEGLGRDGKVTVELGSGSLEMLVAGKVDWELEVEVDGDEIELELELKWSISGRVEDEAAEDGTDEDESEEDESAEGGADEDKAAEDESDEDESEEDELEEDDAAEDGSEPDASVENEAEDGESDEDAASDADVAEPGEAESVQAAAPDRRPAEERRGRRRAPARAGRPSSNGVDTAAVRAWAAANGLAVSPRGRIKEEVLKAYRDAGN
jgi:amphi-Trp domain-containing protein